MCRLDRIIFQSSEDVASSGHHPLGRLNSGGGGGGGFLTRAHTQGDVRFGATAAGNRSRVSPLFPPGGGEIARGSSRSVSGGGAPSVQGRSQSLMEIGTTSYLLGRQQNHQHNESGSLNQTLPKRHHHQVRQDPQQQQQHRRRRSTVTKLKDVPIPEISPIPSPRRRGTEEDQEEEQWVVARTEDGTDSQRKVRGSRSPLDRGTMSPPTSPTAKARQGSRASLASPVEKREAVARSRRTSSNLEGVRGMGGGGSSNSSSNVSEAIARHRAEQHQLVGWKRTSISEFRAIEAKELGGRSTSTPQSGASASSSSSSPGAIMSMGKPASRSSSFTIAERKKSFESMARSGVVTSGSNSSSAAAAVPPKKTCLGNPPGPQRRPHHSSQDSLSVVAPRRTSRESLFETGGVGVGVYSSVSSLASTTASRRSSRDTICEEAETRMAVSPPHPPPPPAATAYGGGGGGSRRSSRSEADGGSRVTTPTKSAAAAAAAPVTSTPSAPVDRSSSVTPTERRGGGAVVSRNSSRASERSARIHADTEEEPPLLPPKKRSSAADYYSRPTSAVSKDSGFTEDAPKKPAPSAEDRWSALERKYSTGTPADRTREGKMDVVVVSGSSLVSPTSAMSIRELSEKFRAPTEGSSSDAAVTTATAVAASATSSRRNSTSSSSVQSGAAGEVEELCSASFRLGERTSNFSWLEESAVGPPKQPFFYLPEESTEWESFDPADATTTTHAQSVGSRMMMTVAAAAMPMPVTSSPAPNSRATMAAKGRKFSAPVYSSSGRTAAARGEEGGVRMREKDDCSKVPSRPSSLVEGADGSERAKAFEVGNLGATASVAATAGSDLLSSSNSRGSSQADLLSDAGCSSHNSGDALILLPGCGGGRSGSSVASGSATPHKSPALYRSTAATTGPSPSSFRSGGGSGGGGGTGGSESAGAAAAGGGGGGKDERRCVSVNDIRRAFEKAEQSLSQSMAASASECGSNGSPSLTPQSKVAGGKAGSSSSSSGGGGGFPSAPSHHRMSSMDSTASDESSIPAGTPHYYGSVSSLLSGHAGGGGGLKDHYGSISSLASSTSLISPNVSAVFLFFFCFRLKT